MIIVNIDDFVIGKNILAIHNKNSINECIFKKALYIGCFGSFLYIEEDLIVSYCLSLFYNDKFDLYIQDCSIRPLNRLEIILIIEEVKDRAKVSPLYMYTLFDNLLHIALYE